MIEVSGNRFWWLDDACVERLMQGASTSGNPLGEWYTQRVLYAGEEWGVAAAAAAVIDVHGVESALPSDRAQSAGHVKLQATLYNSLPALLPATHIYTQIQQAGEYKQRAHTHTRKVSLAARGFSRGTDSHTHTHTVYTYTQGWLVQCIRAHAERGEREREPTPTNGYRATPTHNNPTQHPHSKSHNSPSGSASQSASDLPTSRAYNIAIAEKKKKKPTTFLFRAPRL